MAFSLKLEELGMEAIDRQGRPRSVGPKIDNSIERLGWLMDDLIRIPGLGWRFGLDAIIGLIPAVGDTTTSLVSFYILASAVRYRVPKITLLRMGLNLAIDYAVGSLPVAGDLFDAFWKSNQMNIELLKRSGQVSVDEAKKGRASDWLFVGAIIVGLVALSVGSAAVSIYLLIKLGQLIGAGL
jgi:hypothetical protein